MVVLRTWVTGKTVSTLSVQSGIGYPLLTEQQGKETKRSSSEP